MNMNSEPIRIPATIFAALLVIGPVVVAWLLGYDVREAVATAIVGLMAGGGVIARAESVRARTDSPATIDRQIAEGRAQLEGHPLYNPGV